MNIANPIPSTVSGISFSFLTPEDIRRISVKQIVNPVLLDDLNRPNVGGLYDPALGPCDLKDLCATCRLGYFHCPGHFGHIELPAPVYHPLFMVNTYNLLRTVCQFCHKFKAKRTNVCKYTAKLTLLDHGLLDAAQGLDDIHQRTKSKHATNEMDMEEDENDQDNESDEEFMNRIQLYVKVHLYRASSSKRDDYKDSLVYQVRKEVITQFLHSAIVKSCQNCGAPGYTYRKEGHTKIIEYDLTSKQKALVSQTGLVRPDVLLQAKNRSAELQLDGQPALDSPESTDDDAGEDVMLENEDEGAGSDNQGVQVPRPTNGRPKTKRGRNERIVPAEECRAHLRRLFKTESTMCSLLYGRHGPFAPVSRDGLSEASADIFFMEVLPVSPTRFRPPAKLGETLFEHPQNELLNKILRTSFRLRDLSMELRAASAKQAMLEDSHTTRMKHLGALIEALIQLQVDVNSYVDSGKNPTPMRQGKLPPAGIKQGLEKKDGLFRMHMMGKRVNFAARSVISPDVNIEPNEIGIPPVFARKLTFPEPVTQHNFRAMRDLVIRGPREYPGAILVEYEDGHMQYLDKLSLEQRTAIANQLLTPQEGNRAATMSRGLTTRTMATNKKVHRHLKDGDILLLNRQPTLHKPSMMAHKARVLQGEKTIRMHYANCNSYNADFDGDENEVARAEAFYIANTDNQYLVPTSGKPLRGLIQDHVVAGLWMTNKSTFFSREEYHQLLYGSLRPEGDSHNGGRLLTLPPAIWKPKPRWTGKQIISTILRNITPDTATGLNLRSKSQISGLLWGKGAQEEGDVLVLNGELLCGILDKSQVGASQYGIVHSVHELYGAEIAGCLLGILSRLFTKFLQHRAFTCRMDDLVLTDEGNRRRKKLREDGRMLGTDAAIDNFPALGNVAKSEIPGRLKELLEDVLFDEQKMADLDRNAQKKMHEHTRTITDACMPNGLFRQFPENHMQAMTVSGAKGSSTNAQLISCGLGQQSLEGRRVPVMVSGKTLPSFRAFETAAIAGGYVGSRFLTGIRPQEFYFHCMAGREGLIDTAVKTSRSGYLQRCLIKHLEGIRVHYDHTVRGSDASIYQFQYGGDGIDVTKQKHLYQFEFAVRNESTLVNRTRPKALIDHVDDVVAISHMKKVLKRSESTSKALEKTFKYPPTLSLYSPSRYLGSTSEKFARDVNDYIKRNPDNLIVVKKNEPDKPHGKGLTTQRNFRLLMNVRYMRSLVESGEAVGLLASQGIGEPSTQMTLNTFHLAGHGAANVTLGIPRLREIVMTASPKPKTPNMTLNVLAGASLDDIDRFCKRASRLTLSQLVDNVIVKERLCLKYGARTKEYIVNIHFFPSHDYQKEYHITADEILGCLGTSFATILRKEILLELKRLEADLKTQSANVGKGQSVRDSGVETFDDDQEADVPAPRDNNNGSELGDGDADEAKRVRQSKQHATYDDDSDSEENVMQPDDAATEAAYNDATSDQLSEAAASSNGIVDGSDEQVKTVEAEFLKTVKKAKSFSFGESECSFTLEFGSDIPKLLLVGVIERTCLKTVVREIPDIKDCFLVNDGKDGSKLARKKLMTNGSNFAGMWQHASGVTDMNTIYSNDIFATLCTYGVEMARGSIVREMRAVFEAYSIGVDGRHLELIADYMTFDGGYKPFNRKGISTNSSPLLKASFETTASFISDAALHGDFDDLSTPSGRIVLGRPSTSGTASFGIMLSTT